MWKARTNYPFMDEITNEWQIKIRNGECNNRTKVEFICQNKEHNHPNYMQSLDNHIKHGCPVCGKEQSKEKSALTQRRKDYPFMNEITPYWQEKIRNGECTARTKVEFICQNPDVDHPNYMQELSNHKRSGCPLCGKLVQSNKIIKKDYPFMNEITEEWQEKIKNGKCNWETKVEFVCQNPNEDHPNYMQKLGMHYKYGCPLCGRLTTASKTTKTDYPFMNEITGEWQEKIRNGEVRSGDKVEFICQNKEEHHPNYMQTLDGHTQEYGCPICGRQSISRKLRKTDYPFMSEITPEWQEKIKNSECDLKTKVEFICQNKEKNHPNYFQSLYLHVPGMDCPMCAREKSSFQRTRKDYPFMDEITPEYQELIRLGKIQSKDKVEFICEEHGSYFQSLDVHSSKHCGCPQCVPIPRFSKAEKEIVEILSQKTTVIENDRKIIAPYEIDIFLPEFNIGIEFNGIYWHSTKFRDNNNIHMEKYFLAQSKGIHLIQIWDKEYSENPNRIVNLILSHCNLLERTNIGARNCIVKAISSGEKRDFLNTYHIQKDDRSFGYGLFYDSELVSLIGIRKQPSNTKINEKNTYVLSRYCGKDGVYVVGGFQKLLKFAEKDLGIDKWVSFGDLRIVDIKNNIYLNDGWQEDKMLSPDYQYIFHNNLVHKFNFRLKRFREDPSLEYYDGLTEFELAELNNIPRVYDCGKVRYVKYVG